MKPELALRQALPGNLGHRRAACNRTAPRPSRRPCRRRGMRGAREGQWRAAARLSCDPAKLRQRRRRAKTRDAADGFGRRGAAAHGRSDSLATSLERARCWRCADTSDAAEADTRFMRALKKPEPAPATPDVLENAGLLRGKGEGVFVTGDLCPSRRPLDRDFLELLAEARPGNARRPGHLGPVDGPSRRRSRLAEATGGQRRAEHRLGQSFLSSPLRQKPPRRANLSADARGRHRRGDFRHGTADDRQRPDAIGVFPLSRAGFRRGR